MPSMKIRVTHFLQDFLPREIRFTSCSGTTTILLYLPPLLTLTAREQDLNLMQKLFLVSKVSFLHLPRMEFYFY